MGFSPPIQTAGSGIYEQTEEGRKALARGGIPPETAGRFGGVIAFSPLDRDARGAITAQQITALGREYGLTVTPSPTLAQALTPEESFSVRSNAAYLEGILTPVFLGQSPGEYLLAGTPQAISLLPKAPPKKGPEPVKAGSMPGSRLSWGPDGKDAGHPR